MIDRTQAPPFEKLAQLEHFGQGRERLFVAVFGHDALVLILDFAAALAKLLEHHPERLQKVERLEAGDDDGPAIMIGDEIVRPVADHHADVTGAEEAVEIQFR